MTESSPTSVVCRRIACLFNCFGERDYIGEPVSIISHSLQAAALAQASLGDEEVTVAALLHDIGHIIGMEAGYPLGMSGCGIPNHEGVAGDFLRLLNFTARIQKLVRHHVTAKRYLCFKNPGYHSQLSDASKTTLTFQGGILTAEEASQFEMDPDHETIILMRTWDEQAKVPNLVVPPLESYYDLIDKFSDGNFTTNPSLHLRSTAYVLSDMQRQFYEENGYLRLPSLLPFEGYSAELISSWVSEIAMWPKATDQWLIHWEENKSAEGGKQLCRVENFAMFHEGMKALCGTTLRDAASQLFGEEAALFKEKINFKLPGGAGFKCHQDSPAYIGLANSHISVMVAIDAATLENGCLEVAPGRYEKDQIPLNADGVVTPEAETAMQFVPVTCSPGEVMLFSGYLPHRSGPNETSSKRGAMYITYNPLSEGDFHKEYYEAKHRGINGFGMGHTISFQNDFGGKIVD